MKLRFTISIPNWIDRICARPVLWYRERKFGYPFRKIRLTDGKFAIVDPQDFHRLNIFQWFAEGRGNCFYAITSLLSDDKSSTIVRMHRDIINAPAGLLVDHINSDPLDNRRANLRLATHSQNTCNRQIIEPKGSSRFRGVQFRKQRQRWVAVTYKDKKLIWIGTFDSEIDAAKAYDETAKKYYGEFARLNFTP